MRSSGKTAAHPRRFPVLSGCLLTQAHEHSRYLGADRTVFRGEPAIPCAVHQTLSGRPAHGLQSVVLESVWPSKC